MTQVVAAGNWSYAMVVADRRFTVGGRLVDESHDEQNKLILVATPTARLAVAFCGLAAFGQFRTEAWLSELIFQAVGRGGGTPDLNWMCERATNDFAHLPRSRLRQQDIDPLCLWVVLAGFVSESEGVVPAYAFFRNAHSRGTGVNAGAFVVDVFGPMSSAQRRAQRGYAMSFGAIAVDESRVDTLRGVVDRGQSAHAAVGAALGVIRAARSAPGGQRLIGGRCGAVIVSSGRERQPEGWYFGPRNARTHFMPTLVTRHGIETNVAVRRNRRDRRSSSGVRGVPRPG